MPSSFREVARPGYGPGMNLDHLVYAAPDLAAAVEDVARLTGVRPVPGGSHVGKGTGTTCWASAVQPS